MSRTLADKVWDLHVVKEGAEPASPTCSTSTFISCTRSLHHRPSTVCGFPAGRCAVLISRSPPRTTTSRPATRCCRSPIRSAAPRSRRCARTAPSSASGCYPMNDPGQGIVHVVGPQLGLTQPGMTVVCGDSHTSTHGAFGAIAFGIGTSEVEHVLATQTLPNARPKMMAVNVEGELPRRGHGQGHRACRHCRDRHRRRPGPHHRVPRQRDPRSVDGRPDDGLQHEHRSRRARRTHRAGRDDVRLPARAVRTRRRAPCGTRRCGPGASLHERPGCGLRP